MKTKFRVAVSLSLTACALSINACGPLSSPIPASPKLSPQAKAHDVNTSVTIPIGPDSTGRGTSAFGTNPLVVQPGTIVTWINNDTGPHTITSDTGVWDSGMLPPGQSYSYSFDKSGTYSYHCAVNGVQSMSGVIQVGGDSPSSQDPYAPPQTVGDDDDRPFQPQQQKKPKPKPYPTKKPMPKPYPRPTDNPYPWPTPTPTLY